MLTQLEGASISANLPLFQVLAELPFDRQGLLTTIVQQFDTREVLMLARMDRVAINETLATGFAYEWFCLRQALWHKGETSYNVVKSDYVEVV